ncbi:MAG: response regulator [Bacteroidia bacterium]|nr:response regulator [Bacteroidia bacterium]
MSTILIIEDNIDIQENISELLQLSGYETAVASNGKEGVRIALESLPDLILCDIMMPELDGYGVLHILSRHEETLRIPFVFLTAKADKFDVRKGMTLGADDYITKPFDESDLLTAIENRLRKSQSQGTYQNKKNDINALFQNKQIKNYSNKDIIYRDGDTPSYAYFLNSGKVKIQKMNKDGKEVIIELCNDGDFFGYWSILENNNQQDSAEAIEDSEVWLIPIDEFKKNIEESPEISSKFLKLLSKNLLIKEHKILEMAYESVRKRIANALIEMCDKYGEENRLKMKIPRELIASMAGTSVETAIRMLSEFKKDNLIEIHSSEILILDYDKLKNSPF